MTHRPEPQRGFSLTEILVTTTFAPLLGALLYSLAQSSFHSTRMQEAVSETQDTAFLALSLLSRDVRQAGYTPGFAPLVGVTRAENGALAVCADLDGDGDCDDAGESIAFQEDATRHTLTRSAGAAAPQPLVDHLAAGSLQFSYFDIDGMRLEGGGSGLGLEQRRRLKRIDVRFAIAVPGIAPVEASASVELRNVHR